MSQDLLDEFISRLAYLDINTRSEFSDRGEQNPPTIQVIDSQLKYDDPLITTLLQQELVAARTNVLITADHSISTLATAYCERWSIPREAAENFMALACGNSRFPAILLQNPSSNHDWQSFRGMVDDCLTLSWLENVLRAFGLTVNDVIILDICPLLSDQWMTENSKPRVSRAIVEAYELIESVLDCLKPKILISCQCRTKGNLTQMGGLATDFARKLASSTSAARQKRVVRLRYRAHVFHVVQGFHPRYFLGRIDPEAPEREATLWALLRHLFEPCGQWKIQAERLLQLEKAICNLASVMKASETAEGVHAKNRPSSYQNGGEAKVRFRDVPKFAERSREIEAGRRDASTSTKTAPDWCWVSGLISPAHKSLQ